MPAPTDPATFRRRATRIYRASLAGLALVSAASLGFAWLAAGRWGVVAGLAIAAAGLAFTAGGAVAATLLWAMSQDGG